MVRIFRIHAWIKSSVVEADQFELISESAKFRNSRESRDQNSSLPYGFIPVYVIPLSYLSSLLRQCQEENKLSLQPINLSCSVQMFEAVLDVVTAEKSGHD